MTLSPPPPQKIVFGLDALRLLPGYLAAFNWRRLLLVTTRSARSTGRAGQVEALLGPALAAVFDRAQPHVPADQVDEVLAQARAHDVDAVLGLGGGSAIGLAKAVSYRLNESTNGDAPGASNEPRVPVVAVPTTYAGSEMTAVFGVTEVRGGALQKITTRDRRVLPRLVIYDPGLTLDLPPALTASTGLNALAHCVEALYAIDRHPLSTAAALAGAHALGRALPRCFANGADLDARTEMLEGAHLAGKALADVSMALHHGLCHVLGGSAGVPHGQANAIILPHAMRFNLDATALHQAALAQALGLAGPDDTALAQAGIAHLEALVRSLGLPQRLRATGVPLEDLPRLAGLAARSQTVKNNPKPVTLADAEAILQAAW